MKRTLDFFGRKVSSDVRELSDLKEVIYDKKWFSKAKDFSAYYMYRDLAKNENDRKILEKNKIRYDITQIPPLMLGCEYVKTLGHYHPLVPNTKFSYPEIYEVLEGKAHYLLQNLVNGKVTDVLLIEAKKGEVVLIPPGYGHITINPSPKELKMANLVASNFHSVYEQIIKKKGAAYFETKTGWIKNENYAKVPDIKILAPAPKELFGKDICSSFMKNPKKFEFLTKPQLYSGLFEELLLKSQL